ncbi:MAG: tRNA (5-methylaminomethyl-2-thiouridine)(34)-methyltransferase MnmD [Flavobacteriia bacterium]|jgi:tRNA U34 5-methylaminomethyl-2-thiouridine-forming methyltransferase MnmC
MKREVILTADGSKTIFIPEMDENYHSGHGALQEAVHVFIRNGLSLYHEKKEVWVFEMGFGTGLNALLSLIEAEKNGLQVNYTGIEAFPVEEQMAVDMNYPSLLGEEYRQVFQQLHKMEWDKDHKVTPNFSFRKVFEKIEEHIPQTEQFDLVYFDAFGPRAQQEMWAPLILTKMHEMLKPGGALVTYCAKGQVKRDLKAIGFKIEALPGPLGKREMTRAVKIVNY